MKQFEFDHEFGVGARVRHKHARMYQGGTVTWIQERHFNPEHGEDGPWYTIQWDSSCKTDFLFHERVLEGIS